MNQEIRINAQSSTRLQWDAADVAKFLMSVSVVVLHTEPFGELGALILTPALRLAVPLFFMISARLFFTRLGYDADWVDARRALAHYALRTTKLYMFWLLVLFIPTVILRGWSLFDPINLFLELVYNLLFGSTFVASWYLSASLVGLSIMILLRYRMHWSWNALTVLAFILYFLCLATSSYSWALTGPLARAASGISQLFSPYNSFPVAIFWLTVGVRLSFSKSIRTLHNPQHVVASAIGMAALYLEWSLLKASAAELIATDALLCLPLAAAPLFVSLINCDLRVRHARELRSSSTIIYCFHGTVSRPLYYVLVTTGHVPFGAFLVFLVVLLLSLLVSFVILQLSSKPRFFWLKIAY